MRAKDIPKELLAKLKLRTTAVTADAAYVILSRDSRNFTQQFCIDEDVLREEGISNFEQYAAPYPVIN